MDKQIRKIEKSAKGTVTKLKKLEMLDKKRDKQCDKAMRKK
jgi:hypothetical protein